MPGQSAWESRRPGRCAYKLTSPFPLIVVRSLVVCKVASFYIVGKCMRTKFHCLAGIWKSRRQSLHIETHVAILLRSSSLAECEVHGCYVAGMCWKVLVLLPNFIARSVCESRRHGRSHIETYVAISRHSSSLAVRKVAPRGCKTCESARIGCVTEIRTTRHVIFHDCVQFQRPPVAM